MKVYKKVSNQALYKHIAHQIEELIISGQIKKGDKLPTETELCEEFEVSRTTIRDAIKALQDKGLIQVIQGKGTFVTNDILEKNYENIELILKLYNVENRYLMEAREVLEITIAGLAAKRRTDRDIALLESALKNMKRYISDTNLFLENDMNFHIYLAEATQNILFSTWIKPITSILLEEKEIVKARRERVIESHQKLYEAIVQQDKTRAEEAMASILNQYHDESHTT
ncbi:FadR/GntR family transcriptional regulator [Cytobacillus oceanisediminis]|uniref:HTH gntR-type domain-containing protein n=1 Tax=Cytobacillus oceanisediminis 2691 TaxID=1196031 RepID=A0A160MC79_9BACI|nr:FadR/GntR family transcriptional regulator [Cytobacillus oceanisediminis]AND40510.1 hypothetical protein A361_15585 [Cytobacillus oceanisediminis 2691]MCM3403183.1 FadR family transcriptional regulator [Cytobacillus oceanisediminis]MDK7666265.1 FadR/GntR family transcriptional regulator [Cytobacillus oceanisediminis]